MFEKGLKLFKFEATPLGFVVTVDEIALNDFNPDDNKGIELVKTKAFDDLSQVLIKGLTAKVV